MSKPPPPKPKSPAPPPAVDDDSEDPAPPNDDSEDENDQKLEWLEFTSKDGKKVFFNYPTRSIRFPGEPEDRLPPQAEEPPVVPLSFMHRNRRNSSEPWQGKEDEGMVTAVQADDDEGVELTIENVVDSLSRMIKQLDKILDAGALLTEQMCEDLEEVRNELSTVHGDLEVDGKMALDNRNDVEALLEFKRHKWDFKTDLVAWYRATSQTRPYSNWAYNDWTYPEFFSDTPLPPNCEKITAKVKLPRAGGVPYSEEDPTHSTTVQITQTGILEASVGAAYEKIKHLKLGARTDFVFKASGLNDYLRGERNAFAYEYVRNRVRDQVEVVISLAKKPEPSPEPESVAKLLTAYNEQIDKTITLMDEKTYIQTLDEMCPDMPFDEIKHIPICEMPIPFRVKVCGVDAIDERALPRLSDEKVVTLSLSTTLFHGSTNLDQPQELATVPFCVDPRWDKWCLNGSQILPLNNIPRESRVGFILKGQTAEGATVELGWVVQQLIDEKGLLITGTRHLRLWEFPAKDRGKHAKKEKEDPEFLYRQSTRPNLVSKHAAVLTVKFDEFARPVVAPWVEPFAKPNEAVVGKEIDPKSAERKKDMQVLKSLETADCLHALTADEKRMLWQMRHSLVQYPTLLPKFLQTVQWGLIDHKREAHRLLKQWAPQVSMVHLLELLEARYADYTVRKYAVECLKRIKDEELQLYLLQFTQCLKYEPYHDSPLSRFLIERAIRSPYAVGHYFFWHLKAELHVPQFAERYGVILEDYLSHCGRYAGELRKQYNAVEKCKRVAAMIVRLKREEGYGDDAATKDYFKELHKLNREFFEPMGKFQIPLDPKWEATTLLVEKCRYMSSKMVPLWLVFNNADEDAPPIYIMFKSGDDLRQDILTLQMIRVMDKAWLLDGLDMKLRPYRCIATGVNERGDGVGMIEIVLNSDTTSGIQLKYGGGAMGALKLDPIDLFLRQYNKDKQYDAAVNNFICSCAGYCVATFVLGIGDRHNGNIMVTKDGHLFHIDFGHFLGNFKKKFGVNRERAAFVFTPEMAYVMGGKKYKKHAHFKTFLNLCSRAYKVLRQEATVLEILFVLMVSAGMPELMIEKDIHYLRDKLHLDETEKRANDLLKEEIDKSLTSNYRRFDNMIHNFKHG